MTISAAPYTALAGQSRQATEKSVEVFKDGVRTFTDHLDSLQVPTLDLTEPVARYFDYLQKAVDFNRDLATRWAEIVASLTTSVREQVEQVGSIVNQQTETVADLTVQRAVQAEKVANEQAEQVEAAAQAQAREVKRAERAEAKQAREQAREPYEGLTKVELSDQLAERGLPKSGNVDELIERLVDADSQ